MFEVVLDDFDCTNEIILSIFDEDTLTEVMCAAKENILQVRWLYAWNNLDIF